MGNVAEDIVEDLVWLYALGRTELGLLCKVSGLCVAG